MQDDLSGKSTIRELSIDMISRFFVLFSKWSRCDIHGCRIDPSKSFSI